MVDASKHASHTRSARVARFYYKGSLEAETDLTLDKQASHHLSTVLRSKPGDAVTLFNGDGYNYSASIVNNAQRGSSRLSVLRIHERHAGIPESSLAITLAQCVSRPERMDISLRQAVELGVNNIQPIYSRHSIKVNDEKRAHKKQAHWQSIVISACEQSGRSHVPAIHEPLSYQQWAHSSTESGDIRLLLDPLSPTSLTRFAHELRKEVKPPNITLIIGPESGLDPQEIREAVDTGAQTVHVGHRILRTETAGPACIVLLQSLLGDLQV